MDEATTNDVPLSEQNFFQFDTYSDQSCFGDVQNKRQGFIPQTINTTYFIEYPSVKEEPTSSSPFEESKQDPDEKTVITIQKPGQEPKKLIFSPNCEIQVEERSQGTTIVTINNSNCEYERSESISTLDEDVWKSMKIEKGNNFIRVHFDIPQQNLRPDYYKNFPKKIIDIYLMKANITGAKKRNDLYGERISQMKLRDNASIKKIAVCWREIPEFRREFTKYVLESIFSSDMKTTQLSGKHDSNLLRQCYTQMLFGLKKILSYLLENNLINQYEPVHFWPKIDFRKRDMSDSEKLEQSIKEEES